MEPRILALEPSALITLSCYSEKTAQQNKSQNLEENVDIYRVKHTYFIDDKCETQSNSQHPEVVKRA